MKRLQVFFASGDELFYLLAIISEDSIIGGGEANPNFFYFFSQTSIEAEVVAAYNPDWTKHCLVFNPPAVWPVIILFKTLALFSRGIYVMVGKVWLLLVLGQRGSASRAAPAMVALSHNEPPRAFSTRAIDSIAMTANTKHWLNCNDWSKHKMDFRVNCSSFLFLTMSGSNTDEKLHNGIAGIWYALPLYGCS